MLVNSESGFELKEAPFLRKRKNQSVFQGPPLRCWDKGNRKYVETAKIAPMHRSTRSCRQKIKAVHVQQQHHTHRNCIPSKTKKADVCKSRQLWVWGFLCFTKTPCNFYSDT